MLTSSWARRAAVATALTAVAGLSACTSVDSSTAADNGAPVSTQAPSSASATAPTPTTLHASFRQERIQEGTRQFNARLTNTSNADVVVLGVALRSPVLEPLPMTPKDSELTPGRIIDFATEYGDPRCDIDTPIDASVVVRLDSGTVVIPIDRHGVAWLKRLYVKECGLKKVAEIATFRFGSPFSRDVVDGSPVLRGVLIVRRTADAEQLGTTREELLVRLLYGSLLVTVDFAPQQPRPPQTLQPGRNALRIPVLFGSTKRCDSHAFEESKQTFLLSAYVKVDGAPLQRIIVVPSLHVKSQTMALLHEVCGI